MSPSASKLVRMTVAVLCLMTLVVVLYRCWQRTPDLPHRTTVEPTRHTAVVTLVNAGNCNWSVDFKPAAGEGDGQKCTLRTEGDEIVVLPEGEYLVEQRLMAAEGGKTPVRRFTMTFEGGRKYRWRLANLLSSDDAELQFQPQGLNRHE